MNIRSSPILSAVDALLAIIKFLWLVFIGCPPRTAARHVWYDRFEESESEESGINRAWVVNMIVFVLGALPQTIKILGTQGIPLSQAFAAMFVAAFIVFEVLRIYAGTAHVVDIMPATSKMTRAKKQFDQLQWVTVIIALPVQVLLWVWTVGELMPKTFVYIEFRSGESLIEEETPPLFWVSFILYFPPLLVIMSIMLFGPFVLALFVTIILVAFAVTFWDVCKGILQRVCDLLRMSEWQVALVYALFCVLTIGIVFSQIYSFVYDRVDPHFIPPTPVLAYTTGALFVIPCCLLVLLLVYRVVFVGSLSHASRRLLGVSGSMLEFWSVAFLVMNCVTIFLYYSHVYNPTGTHKPAWTDALG